MIMSVTTRAGPCTCDIIVLTTFNCPACMTVTLIYIIGWHGIGHKSVKDISILLAYRQYILPRAALGGGHSGGR